MYALDEVAADGPGFRDAFASAQGFRPLYVKIKVIFGCNLRCVMCNHWREPRPSQLSTTQMCAVLDEVAALGCRKVHYTGGEAGLRPDIERLVAHATSVGIRPTMTSNATLFTRVRARRLVEGGLRGINVSIDSPDPATHDRVRGEAGTFGRTLEGLKNLRKERWRGKLRVSINTVITRWNFRTLRDLPKLALRVGAGALRLLPVDEHTGIALRLTPDEITEWNAEIAPELLDRALRAGLMTREEEAYPFGRGAEQERTAAKGEYAQGYYRTRPCFAPFTHALVDHDGDVHVCCMARTGEALGNLHEQSFTDIWRGEAYRRVRLAMHTEKKLAPCARCDDFLKENRRMSEVLEATPPAAPAPELGLGA